jgi:hypothetical protein
MNVASVPTLPLKITAPLARATGQGVSAEPHNPDTVEVAKGWGSNSGGSVTIALITEGGVDHNHPALRGRVLSPEDSASPSAEATHLAGVLVGRQNQPNGIIDFDLGGPGEHLL